MSGMNKPGGMSRTPRPAFSVGCSFAICKVMASSSAFACATVTPGLSRPTTKRLSLSRASSHVLPGSISFAIIIGAQNSGA